MTSSSMFRPKVDVVIPVKDGEQFIAEAIQSVLDQTYFVNRIYIVDDDSKDSTVKVCQKFVKTDTRIEILKNIGRGVSAARNTGLSASSADYVAFLDSDDKWLRQKIELQILRIQKYHNSNALVYVGYSYIDKDSAPLNGGALPTKEGNLFIDLLIHRYSLTSSASGVLAPREIIQRVGGFDENMWWGEDWDLWVRLAKELPCLMVDSKLVEIRIHSQSSQRRERKNLAQDIFLQHSILFSKWPKYILRSFWFMRFYVAELASALSPHVKRPLRSFSVWRDLFDISPVLFILGLVLMPIVLIIIPYRFCKKHLFRMFK